MFNGRNLLCLYPQLLNAVEQGIEANPRGMEVTELPHPALWTLSHPQEWPLCIPGRKFNPFFALAEVVWMWSGKGGADFIQFYNKSITQFLDKGIPYFHGSYGKRVRHSGYSETPFRSIPSPRLMGAEADEVEVDQLIHVISKLQADPDTRQGVVSLWDPIKDNFVSSKDHPCNNMLYFWIRNGALNFTVVRRSNDLVWGVPYNMCQFSHLHALMAGSLGVGIGQYHVMANNLHFYKNLYPDTLHTVTKWKENVEEQDVNLEQVSNAFFRAGWDMRWSLDKFDRFISMTWDPLEMQMRKYLEHQLVEVFEHASSEELAQNTVESYYQTRAMSLDMDMESMKVPDYWRHVFRLLLAYHCRKAKCMKLFQSLVASTPTVMQWLVNDFYSKEGV